MSGSTKNKLSNINLRALLERINESPTKLGREFHLDHTTIYYYRKKLIQFKGKVKLFVENKQRGNWKYTIPSENQDTEIFKPNKCYADYLQDEENKKNRKIERLFTNHKIK